MMSTTILILFLTLSYSIVLPALINAECISDVDKVELLVDDKPWPSSDVPLYKPVGSNGAFVRCQRCNKSEQPAWFDSSDKMIPTCDNINLICFNRPGSGVRDLNFLNFTLSQVGSYTCKKSGDMVSIMINALSLLPISQLTNISMSVTLKCETTGSTGSITYQWETKKDNGGQWMNISNSNSKTLVVGTLEQSQQYRCIVSNEAGSTRSNVATVNVLKITTHPQNKLVTDGSTVTLSCTSSVSSDVTFSWTHNGTSISGSSTTGDTSILTITSVRHSDAGSYVCTVRSGSLSTMSNPATLTVYGPPTIITHPTSQLTTMSMSVTLDCEGTGRGNIAYQWESKRINSGRWMNVRNSNNRRLVVGTLEQSQQYRCVVSNEAGRTRSNVATVTVLKITANPQNKVVAVTSTVSLTCASSLSSDVTFSWTHNGTTAGDTSMLTITSVRHSDAGSYVCTVRSGSLSVMSSTATLTVYGPPTIMTHPTSQLTTMSMSVTLDCEGTGRGNIAYQWESKRINSRKWMNVRNNNNRRLVVGTLEQSQQYRCVVSNEAGSTTSNVATVTVLKITTHPVSHSEVVPLENITLCCSASVDGVTYSWHRVNGNLPAGSTGQNSHILTIHGVTPHDEGTYYCMASKERIRVESNRATLNVDDQFSISITSSIEIVMRNKFTAGERTTVNFTAIVNSVYKNNFSYQWQKKDEERLPRKVASVNGAVLIIPNILKSDEGKYYCNVTNEWGRSVKSKDITLSVKDDLPMFWRHPEDQIIENNQTATFKCFVNGSKSISVVWEKNRKKYIIRNKDAKIHTNGGNSTLTLNRATVNDGGKYRCRATNTVPSKEAELIIRPEIITNPNDTTVIIGQSVQLIYEVLGTNLVYQWMKDSVIVSGADSNVLIINSTNKSDEGMYSCVASNKGGMVESNPATVTVYGPPTAEKLPQRLHVVLGENFQITCTATNDQDAPMNLMFSWKIPNGIQYNVTTSDEDKTRTAFSTLYVSAVTHNHSGMYHCIVKNGEHIRNVNSVTSTVVVEEQSSPPLNFNIIHINTSLFKLIWSSPKNPNGRIDYYTVYYDNYDYDQSEQLINVTNFGMYTLDNLRPHSVYSVYVTAVRIIGDTGRPLQGMKSDIVTKRTLAGVPVLEYGNQSKVILNDETSTLDGTFMIDLPTIQHGLFRYIYIAVITDNTITNIESISTASLLEESMKSYPLFYVAAVVNVSQYVLGKGLSYILGAGDYTTDINNQVFYNRKVKGNQLYFFRIFSFDSTPENKVFITTELQKISVKQPVHIENGDNDTNNSNVSVMAVAILAVVSMVSIISVIVLAVFVFKLKMQLQATDKKNGVKQAANTPDPTYELAAKLDDMNMENNPAYSMHNTPMHHHYDFIPENNHTKVKQ